MARYVRLTFNPPADDKYLGVAEVGFVLAPLLHLSFSVEYTTLTPANNLARFPPFEDRWVSDLAVLATFDDGVTKVIPNSLVDFETDVALNCAILLAESQEVMVPADAPWSCEGFNITATIDECGLRASKTDYVEVVRLVSVDSRFDAWPAGDNGISYLSPVPCSYVYERASIFTSATRSDGVTRPYSFRMNYVSSNTTVARIVFNESLAGNLTLMWGDGPGVVSCGYLEEVAHYNSSNTSGVAVTVAEAEVLPRQDMVNWTFVGRWSLSDQDHLRLVRNTREPHMFDLSYTTNTGQTFTYFDLTTQTWIEPWLVINFTSTRPDLVTIDDFGDPTIYQNFYAEVLLTAQMCCTPDSWIATPWINLLPGPEDIDLGTDPDNYYAAFYHPDANETEFVTYAWARPKEDQYLRGVQLECVFPEGVTTEDGLWTTEPGNGMACDASVRPCLNQAPRAAAASTRLRTQVVQRARPGRAALRRAHLC